MKSLLSQCRFSSPVVLFAIFIRAFRIRETSAFTSSLIPWKIAKENTFRTLVVRNPTEISLPQAGASILGLQPGLDSSLSEAEALRILAAQQALVSPQAAKEIQQWRRARSSSIPVSIQSHISRDDSIRESSFNGNCEAKDQQRKKPKQQQQKRKSGLFLPYSSAIEALRAYHSIHGDLVIPRRFVVPKPEKGAQSPYPKEWHGVDLASSVYNMKWWLIHVKERPKRVSELNELNFVWGRLQPEWNIVLEALITYYSIHGDVMVTNKFVVPHGYRIWPVATWGIPLGNIVFRIRSRNDFLCGPQSANRRDQLDRLGFVWDVHESRFQKFYRALQQFAYIHKMGAYSQPGREAGMITSTRALRVPSTFVVPSNDELWPKDLWNFELGVKCTAVRQKGLYVKHKPDRQQMLEELGFRWSGNTSLGWLHVVHAAAIYSKLNNRNLDVPFKFVVPEPPAQHHNPEEWPWPQHLWGFPLGQRLKDVRCKNAYLKGDDADARRQQLDALGFVWNPKRGRKPAPKVQ